MVSYRDNTLNNKQRIEKSRKLEQLADIARRKRHQAGGNDNLVGQPSRALGPSEDYVRNQKSSAARKAAARKDIYGTKTVEEYRKRFGWDLPEELPSEWQSEAKDLFKQLGHSGKEDVTRFSEESKHPEWANVNKNRAESDWNKFSLRQALRNRQTGEKNTPSQQAAFDKWASENPRYTSVTINKELVKGRGWDKKVLSLPEGERESFVKNKTMSVAGLTEKPTYLSEKPKASSGAEVAKIKEYRQKYGNKPPSKVTRYKGARDKAQKLWDQLPQNSRDQVSPKAEAPSQIRGIANQAKEQQPQQSVEQPQQPSPLKSIAQQAKGQQQPQAQHPQQDVPVDTQQPQQQPAQGQLPDQQQRDIQQPGGVQPGQDIQQPGLRGIADQAQQPQQPRNFGMARRNPKDRADQERWRTDRHQNPWNMPNNDLGRTGRRGDRPNIPGKADWGRAVGQAGGGIVE